MPTFATPQPISVKLDLVIGDVTIIASDRTDTVVTVTPVDPADNLSVEAARRVRVEHSPHALGIKQGLPWYHSYTWKQPSPSAFVVINVELPTGSRVSGQVSLGKIASEGSLDDWDMTLHYGEARLDEISHALRMKVSNGNIRVQRACADVDLKTSNGSIRIDEVISGSVSLSTAVGAIEVGVREGTAVDLDVRTKLGRVRNNLNSIEGPGDHEHTVTIHAQTNLDDIVIKRS